MSVYAAVSTVTIIRAFSSYTIMLCNWPKRNGVAKNCNTTGVAKFTRSEERGCGFVLRKFQQARTARVCTLALLLNDLEIDSSLLPSLIPSLK